MSGMVPTADRLRSPLVGFLLARATSMLGDGVFEIAVPVIAIERTGSPLLAGIAVAAQQVPGIFLGLAAGSLDASLGRRALLIASDLWRVAVLLLLLVALTADAPLAPALILAAIGLGIGDTSFYVSSGSIMPSLVERPRLISANAALESVDAGATLLAPLIAGVLVQVMGGGIGGRLRRDQLPHICRPARAGDSTVSQAQDTGENGLGHRHIKPRDRSDPAIAVAAVRHRSADSDESASGRGSSTPS